MNDDLIKIFTTFGLETQRRKLNEETLELLDALTKYDLTGEGIQDILEEMADVMVLLAQFQTVFNISDFELENNMKYKVLRTIDRINSNYYEKDIEIED